MLLLVQTYFITFFVTDAISVYKNSIQALSLVLKSKLLSDTLLEKKH